MPRVTYVKRARKKNPVADVGEDYYWWKFPFGRKRYSKTRPRPSQLTQSDKIARVREYGEAIDDAVQADTPHADLIEVVREAAEGMREVAEEYMESADNIRDHFEVSETADQCEESSYTVEGVADELDEIVSEAENDDDYDIVDALSNIDYSPL